MTRKNRLWLAENRATQATMVICKHCGEAYEPDRAHVCKKVNSYPVCRDIKGEV